MTRNPTSALLRLPREPYPGLRPFLDFESALMYGRRRQADEIVERLARTQFVAVLGGSGSGKSSLVLAGVMPQLRAHGIPGAGDFWLALVCTPGTADDGSGTPGSGSPIARLARSFAALLSSTGGEAGDAARLQGIAAVLRQEAGFARLLDAYSAQFDIEPGPDPQEARLLVVLDQFEELFHPAHRGHTDASVFVERVLDHFFNPHPRCHVVLTMRSEFLADCAAFLQLPDAINASSYLVRRLDAAELQEVIEAPAQRFLRLVARSHRHRDTLPPAVQFDPAVIERLTRDTFAISADPDHLPLLQHLLARLWQAALEREEIDVSVPAHITEMDLVRAVNARPGGSEQTQLPASTNVLREALNNWLETLFLSHDGLPQMALHAIFVRLAFKDPASGRYSRQRLLATDAAALLGAGRTVTDVRALLAEGFVGGVDYLMWDDSDPTAVSIKVSHEAFIRGWHRLRGWVDEEARRIEQLQELMRRAEVWQQHGCDADFLLSAGEWRRAQETGIDRLLADAQARGGLMRSLALASPGTLLTDGQFAQTGEFFARTGELIEQSRRRQLQRQRQRRIAWLAVFTVPLLLAGYALIFVLPSQQRVELLLQAARQASTPWPAHFEGPEQRRQALQPLLAAAEDLDRAKSGRGIFLADASDVLTRILGSVGRQDRWRALLVEEVLELTEPQVNNALRQALLNPALTAPGAAQPAAAPRALQLPEVRERVALHPAAAGSACASLAAAISGPTGARDTMFDGGDSCLVVRRSVLAGQQHRIGVALYNRPHVRAVQAPLHSVGLPLAVLGDVASVHESAADPTWAWGLGQWGGWLIMLPGREDAPPVAVPLQTCALWRIAARMAAGSTPAGVCG